MLTEQSNPNSQQIDLLSTLEIVQVINAEDQKVAQVVAQALPAIAQAVDGIVERLQSGGRLFYVGAGTSGRLGILDAAECVPTFGVDPDLVVGIIAGGEVAITQAVEGSEDDRETARADLKQHGVSERDAVVGIAASGRTPYVLEAMAYAREIGALTIGLSCNVPAQLLEAVEIPIGVPVGPEVIAGSTRMKAGTAQKMVLNQLSTATMIKLGKVYGNLMVDVQPTNSKLVARAQHIVSQITGVDTETAADLLERAHYHVKAAIVMQHLDVSYEEAQTALEAKSHRLHAVIDDPQ